MTDEWICSGLKKLEKLLFRFFPLVSSRDLFRQGHQVGEHIGFRWQDIVHQFHATHEHVIGVLASAHHALALNQEKSFARLSTTTTAMRAIVSSCTSSTSSSFDGGACFGGGRGNRIGGGFGHSHHSFDPHDYIARIELGEANCEQKHQRDPNGFVEMRDGQHS